MPETPSAPLSIIELLLRFSINLVAVLVLVRLIYYPRHRNRDFLFTFFLFNLLNFLICYLLSASTIKIGFAFGLFAIFSIMRYRTVVVPIKEMGYFFTCVAMGLLNALAPIHGGVMGMPEEQGMLGYVPLAGINAFIVLLTLMLDRFSLTHENMKEVVYERIDLIGPERRDEMLVDLRARTGLPIHKVEIRSLDFLKDVAIIHAYFYSKESELQSAGAVDAGD